MKVGTTSADAIRRPSSRLALAFVDGVLLYSSGVVGYAADEPVGVLADERVDVELSVLDGTSVEESDGSDDEVLGVDVSDVAVSDVLLSDVLLSDVSEVAELEVLDAEVLMRPAGSGSAVPAIVVAQPATSTAASAAAPAVHLLRLKRSVLVCEPGGRAAGDAASTVNGRGHIQGRSGMPKCDGRWPRTVPPGRGHPAGSCRTARVSSARSASSASGG